MNSKIILIFCFLFVEISYAQLDSTNNLNAIQFYVIGAVSAGYKHNISEKSAYRIKVDISGLLKNEDENDYRTYDLNDSLLAVSNYAIKTNNQSVGINFDYVFAIYQNKNVNMYLGIGPFILLTRTQGKYNTLRYLPSDGYSSSEVQQLETNWQLGISMTCGVECLVYKNISLIGEYNLSGGYGWKSTEYNYINNSYSKHAIKVLSLELSSLKIGINIYI